jgi:hypothetical protein
MTEAPRAVQVAQLDPSALQRRQRPTQTVQLRLQKSQPQRMQPRNLLQNLLRSLLQATPETRRRRCLLCLQCLHHIHCLLPHHHPRLLPRQVAAMGDRHHRHHRPLCGSSAQEPREREADADSGKSSRLDRIAGTAGDTSREISIVWGGFLYMCRMIITFMHCL